MKPSAKPATQRKPQAVPEPATPAKRPPRARKAAAVLPAAATPLKPGKQAQPKAVAAPKPEKLPKKAPKLRPALVRDSFTMPEHDFALIGTLKSRALAGQRAAKKSELLRAGLQALAAMDGPALLAALNQLEPVQIGRPKKAR